MKQQQELGKRIVSKSKYATKQIERTGTAVLGSCFVLIGSVCGTLALICLGCMLRYLSSQTLMQFCLFIVFTIGLGMAMVRTLRSGFAYIREAAKNDVVPLTRANTAHLPAPDSLVRASQEPVQAQGEILLRAATGEKQAANENQLLRAIQGEHE